MSTRQEAVKKGLETKKQGKLAPEIWVKKGLDAGRKKAEGRADQ